MNLKTDLREKSAAKVLISSITNIIRNQKFFSPQYMWTQHTWICMCIFNIYDTEFHDIKANFNSSIREIKCLWPISWKKIFIQLEWITVFRWILFNTSISLATNQFDWLTSRQFIKKFKEFQSIARFM